MEKLKILFFAMIIALASCEFEPNDVYNPDVTKPTGPPNIELELNLDDSDYIIFYWESYIKIKLKNEDIKLWQAEFYLDGHLMYGYVDDGGFSIDVNLYDYGNHTLRIDFYTSSGSNSLADNVGAETYKFSTKEWILVYKDNNMNNNGSALIENTQAKLSWKAFDGINLSKYHVVKAGVGSIEFETTDTTIFDADYIGEEGVYYVYVVDEKDEEFLWAICNTERNLPELKIGEVNNKLVLTWNTTGFEDKIKEYIISTGPYHGSWDYYATVEPNVNYVELGDFEFGEYYHFLLQVVPEKEVEITNDGFFSTWLGTRVAIPGPYFSDNRGSTSKGFVFESSDSVCFYSSGKDSVITLEGLDAYGEYCVSPDANYLAVPHMGIVNLYSVDEFKFIKTVNVSSDIGGSNVSPWLTVTDNGIISWASGNKVVVYDLLNETVIYNANISGNPNIFASPNGKYFLIYTTYDLYVYEFTNNTFVEVNHIDSSNGYFYYNDFNVITDEPDLFYKYEAPNLIVKSMADLSVIRTLNLGTEYFLNIDFTNNKVLSYGTGVFYIHDFNTGELLEQISSDIGGGAPHYTLLCNNIIFFSEYKYYLNN